jgi:hypothetical protein
VWRKEMSKGRFNKFLQGLTYGKGRVTIMSKNMDAISIEIWMARMKLASSSSTKHILRALAFIFWYCASSSFGFFF